MKNYELVSSNNLQFILGVCWKNCINDMYEMKIWNSDNMKVENTFFAKIDLGGKRHAISDDGKYIITAEYEENRIHLYDAHTGTKIQSFDSVKKPQYITFQDDKTILAGAANGYIYTLDFLGKTVKKQKGESLSFNQYGEDILLRGKTLKSGKLIIESGTFSFLTAIGTPYGIAASEAGGRLKFYDYKGDLKWQSEYIEYAHFLTLAYREDKDLLYGICFTYRGKSDDRIKIMCFDGKEGDIVFSQLITSIDCIFIDNCKKIVCGNGMIYSVHEKGIEEVAQIPIPLETDTSAKAAFGKNALLPEN